MVGRLVVTAVGIISTYLHATNFDLVHSSCESGNVDTSYIQTPGMKMNGLAWTYLIIAGIFEIGWPVGLKLAQAPGKTVTGVVLAGACMVVSGYLLFLAQRSIPMGTAYAVWTGIGAAGTFVVGIFLYNDPTSFMRIFGVMLIIGGVITLKLAHWRFSLFPIRPGETKTRHELSVLSRSIAGLTPCSRMGPVLLTAGPLASWPQYHAFFSVEHSCWPPVVFLTNDLSESPLFQGSITWSGYEKKEFTFYHGEG